MPSGNFEQKDGYPSNTGSYYRRVKDCIIQQGYLSTIFYETFADKRRLRNGIFRRSLCEKPGEYDIIGMKCKTDSGGFTKVLQTQGKLNGITNLF